MTKVIINEPLGDWYDEEPVRPARSDAFDTRHWVHTSYDDLHGA